MAIEEGNTETALWQRIAIEAAARRPLVAATVVRDSGSVPRRRGALCSCRSGIAAPLYWHS